jgi:phosphoribosylanthranilate isomerase
MRTRIKICGITRREDAFRAAELGADAIGLVFHADSPRAVTVARARDIVAVLPPFVCVVGLFVNRPAQDISRILGEVRIDVLQFHGDELPEDCRVFGKPYIKAVHMYPGVDLDDYTQRYADALGLLLDTCHAGNVGGTGRTFEWSWVPGGLKKPIILAGGLTPDNVATAIRQVHPYAVDVSSGVEAVKGIKDAAKMAAFIESVRQA